MGYSASGFCNRFTKVQKIDSLAQANNDRELELEVELMRIHYYLYRDYFPKSIIISKSERLNEIGKKEHILWLEIRVLSLLANYYFNDLKEYEKAFEHFELTSYLLRDLTSEEFPLKSACLHQLGWAYFYFRDYTQAIVHFKEAMESYTPRANDFYYIQSINTIGMSYKNLNNLDSSNYYFDVLHQYALSTNNQIWESISAANLGYNYYLRGDIDAAIPLLEFGIETAKKLDDRLLAAQTIITLAEVKYHQNKPVEASVLALSAKEYLKPSNDFATKAKLYPLLAKVASFNSKPALANMYLDFALMANDSLSNMFSGLKVMRARQKVLLEQKKNETKVTLQKQQHQLWIKNSIILGLLALIVIGFLIFNQLRLKSKNRELIILSRKEAADRALELFKESAIKKNEMIEYFEQILNQRNQKKDGNQDASLPNISQKDKKLIINKLFESSLLTDNDWRKFIIVFEKVHTGFFDRVNEKWTELTPSEIRLLALSRLEIDNKKMALMLGVGPDAIRQVKSRLRKKLTQNKAESFEALISSI